MKQIKNLIKYWMLVLGLEGTMMDKESKYDYFDLPKQREYVKIET